MRLTDDELRDVLERAEEIQRTSRSGDAMRAELEAVIGAGEEVGLTRAAVERALRERLDLGPPPVVGDRVFGRSADGRYYVADVVSISGDDIRVRFLRGSEHVLSADQVRSCSFVPGQRVMCDWPWWGPWSCTVITYDPPSQYLKLSDRWGSSTTCHVSDVWIEPERKPNDRALRKRASATLTGLGAGLGALVGSVITALIMW
jgi:hypothetical protein